MIKKSEEFVPNLFTNLDVAAGQVYPTFDKAGARCNIGTLRQDRDAGIWKRLCCEKIGQKSISCQVKQFA